MLCWRALKSQERQSPCSALQPPAARSNCRKVLLSHENFGVCSVRPVGWSMHVYTELWGLRILLLRSNDLLLSICKQWFSDAEIGPVWIQQEATFWPQPKFQVSIAKHWGIGFLNETVVKFSLENKTNTFPPTSSSEMVTVLAETFKKNINLRQKPSTDLTLIISKTKLLR